MKRTLALILCALTLAYIGGTTLTSAENGMKIGKATVRAVHGTVQYTINDGPPMKVRVNMTLDPGATIITGPESYTDLSVNGISSVVRINADSKLVLKEMQYYGSLFSGDQQTMIDLKSGEILGNVKKISADSRYEINTPHGVAGIRGTDFQVTIKLAPDGRFLVTFTSVQGVVIVSALVGANAAPVVKTLTSGQSWTPGEGDVVATELVPLRQALRVLTVLAQYVIFTPPPTPGPHNPFGETGGPAPGESKQ